MRHIILIIALFICTFASAQDIVRKGNTFEQVSSRGDKGTKTQYTWKDSKNNTYPIFITKKGRCFVMKVSSKTNKEYKYYLKEDISKQVCKELNIEYQEPIKKK